MTAKSVMLVGTASHVGKSVLCTALCRIFAQDGLRVAPFKAQNMSLNSAVTPSGREIGRAQATQAEACGLLPNEHMNPVLLKPSGGTGAQVVLQGRVDGNQSVEDGMREQPARIWNAVVESYEFLRERYEVLVVEGAGSPVELNLKARDIANMRTAELADASVYLVADIDKGGVFASVIGTLHLLAPSERARVKGILINKFRGNPALFADGIALLERHANVPVLGIIPYVHNLGIDEEDSVALDDARYSPPADGRSRDGRRESPHAAPKQDRPIRVAIVQFPHLSNFTDVDPLFTEPGVDAYFCRDSRELDGAHAIVLPGTKNTMGDLAWLAAHGWPDALAAAKQRGAHILGICGGYQMMGRVVRDPTHQEGEVDAEAGLGWFDTETTLQSSKRTVPTEQVLPGAFAGLTVRGYEIHMGETWAVRNGGKKETVSYSVSLQGQLFGTYLHGIFHNDDFRLAWLNQVRLQHGRAVKSGTPSVQAARRAAYDHLADVVRQHVKMEQIYEHLRG